MLILTSLGITAIVFLLGLFIAWIGVSELFNERLAFVKRLFGLIYTIVGGIVIVFSFFTPHLMIESDKSKNEYTYNCEQAGAKALYLKDHGWECWQYKLSEQR